MYEIFARSSSASFERQASCDSGTCQHSGHQHLASRHRMSKHVTNLNANSITVPSTTSLASSIISSNYMPSYCTVKQLLNSNRRLINAFRPPELFALVQPAAKSQTSVQITINPLIQYVNQRNSMCSTSGVSTLKSGRSCSTTTNTWTNLNRSKNSTHSSGFVLNRQNSVCTQCQTAAVSSQQVCSHARTCGTAYGNEPLNVGSGEHIVGFNSQSVGGKNLPTSLSCNNNNGQFLKNMLFDTYMEFDEFTQLFKSFYIHMRKDLKVGII